MAYNKNKTYGKEADEEGSQDIADKAAQLVHQGVPVQPLEHRARHAAARRRGARAHRRHAATASCVVCEDEMDKKRLEAVPWAKRCISCQEKQEQGLL